MIKKLKNNFTTVKQGNILLKLGVPTDSADCYYLNLGLGEYSYKPYYGECCDDNAPCWTVGRLVEIYNECIDKEKADKEDITEGRYKLCLEDAYNHDYIQYMIDCFYFAYDFKLLDFSKLEEE